MQKLTSSVSPNAIETRVPKRYLRFDIEETDEGFSYYEIELPVFKWNYADIVAAIVRAKYTQDEVEAIMLNNGKSASDNDRYDELQAWRKHAKEVIRDAGIVVEEEELTPEQELKDLVFSINAEVDANILQGYTYEGHQVWLSTENQFNYKAAYDLAVQTNGAFLSGFTAKLGTDDDPYYKTFSSLEEFSEFYIGAVTHIQQCLAEGWMRKAQLIKEQAAARFVNAD